GLWAAGLAGGADDRQRLAGEGVKRALEDVHRAGLPLLELTEVDVVDRRQPPVGGGDGDLDDAGDRLELRVGDRELDVPGGATRGVRRGRDGEVGTVEAGVDAVGHVDELETQLAPVADVRVL